jgi:hypothetical protein
MSRLIRIVARLYPRPWRERYGEEFSALLEDVNPSSGAAFDIFTGAIAMQIRNWRYGWMVAISAAFACTAFAVMLFTIPKAYVSRGVLLLDGRAPISLDSIMNLAQHMESRMTLASIITSEKLYLRERSRMPIEDVIELMRRNVRLQPVGLEGPQPGVVIDFDYSDPRAAQRVTGKLLASFVDQGNGTLRALDPASLPQTPARPNVPLIATSAAFLGLLTFGLLGLFRRRALRKA